MEVRRERTVVCLCALRYRYCSNDSVRPYECCSWKEGAWAWLAKAGDKGEVLCFDVRRGGWGGGREWAKGCDGLAESKGAASS